MKKTVFLIVVILVAIQTVGFSQKKRDRDSLKSDTLSVDSLDYRIIVLDPGFDTWLFSKPPMNFYSNDYYATKNRLYVAEWNLRYMTENNDGLYENFIDYNPRIDYGIDINYKLYYYFRYFEETNHIRLLDFER
jgi:Family of unknown function (DUF6146)